MRSACLVLRIALYVSSTVENLPYEFRSAWPLLDILLGVTRYSPKALSVLLIRFTLLPSRKSECRVLIRFGRGSGFRCSLRLLAC
jgi:hypothetical protein